MEFDEIKSAIDKEESALQLSSATIAGESKMPIAQVQKTMRGEILTQLICIVIFFVAPFFLSFCTPFALEPFPLGIYLIFMFLTSLMTLGYLSKMAWFLQRVSQVQINTRETILSFIYDLKLTLEVYKTAIVTGSMLLPISFAALLMGNGERASLFYKCFTFDIPAWLLLAITVWYLATIAFFYRVTVKWADKLYGVHVEKLESLLCDWDSE